MCDERRLKMNAITVPIANPLYPVVAGHTSECVLSHATGYFKRGDSIRRALIPHHRRRYRSRGVPAVETRGHPAGRLHELVLVCVRDSLFRHVLDGYPHHMWDAGRRLRRTARRRVSWHRGVETRVRSIHAD